MQVRKNLKPLIYITLSILSFSILFLGLRFYEILIHRNYLLSEPKDLLFRLSYSFLTDFIFFFIFNLPYLFLFLSCEYYKKDKNFFFRKSFFRLTHFFLILLFFLDMQTLAVQDRLFYVRLLYAFKIEMLINSWLFVLDYWYLLVLFFVSSFILFWYLPFIKKQIFSKKQILFSASFTCFLSLLIAISFFISKKHLSFYGEYQYKSQIIYKGQTVFKDWIKDEYPITKEYKYNGLFKRLINLIYTFQCESNFFSQEELLKNLRQNKTEPVSPFQKENLKENIIFFVIESFSKQMITLEDMPFLSDLQSKSLSFENHIAPRFHSTYFSLVSILTGDSDGKLNSSNSFFKDFLNAGYSVSFFFGDSKNMFNWEDFFKQSGVFHISKKEYLKDTGRKEDIDIDGNIFEDVFLKYSVKKLKSGKVGEPPFFMTILTNQIHYPYYCSKSTNTTSSSLKKIKDCAKHVDSAIKDFFKEIENTTWFNKTLFVFTADHPNYYFWKDPVNYFSKRNIPLIFYHPNKDLSKYKDDQISSHIDIIPSLIDYLNLSKKNNLIQNSVFDLNNKRRFFIKKDRGYVLIEDNYLTEYNCQTKQSTTYLKAQTGEIKNLFNEEIIKKQDKLIKSYIQYKSLMENN